MKDLSFHASSFSGRIKAVKAPAAGTPTIVNLSLTSNHEILLDMAVICSPLGTALQNVGVKIKNGSNTIYPAAGSNDDAASFPGNVNGYGVIIPFTPLVIQELNQILDGPPYQLDFEFYNLDTVNDVYFAVLARSAAKVELSVMPVTETKKQAEETEEK